MEARVEWVRMFECVYPRVRLFVCDVDVGISGVGNTLFCGGSRLSTHDFSNPLAELAVFTGLVSTIISLFSGSFGSGAQGLLSIIHHVPEEYHRNV